MSMMIENGSTPTIVFYLVDEGDSESPEPGLSPTVTISKNGGNFDPATNSVSQVLDTDDTSGTGWYKLTLDAGETDTDGPLIIRASASGTELWADIAQVVTSLPAEIVEFTAAHPDVAITSAGLDEIVTALLTADLEAETTAYLAGSGTGPKAAKTFLGIAHKLNGAVQGGSVITVYAFDGVTPLWTHSIVTDTDVETITSQGAPA